MTTIVTRAGKGAALTYAEVDSNFTNLNTAKYEAGNAASLFSLTLSSALAVSSGGTGATTSTGSGSVVLSTSPTLTAPDINGGTADDLASISAASGYFANSNTIPTTQSIPASHNATSVGPITIPSGVAFTVPSGQRWAVF